METVRTHSQQNAYAEQPAWRKACILTVLSALFAFLGWISETALFLIVRGEFVDRGLLTMPFCPLYGLGMLGVYIILKTPQSGIWAKIIAKADSKSAKFCATVLCLIVYAALAALLASVAEYATGFFFDRKFGVRLWSYRRYEDNINGYVSLRYSALWGLLAVSSMGLVWYPVQNALTRLNTAVLSVIAVILFTAVTADFAFNLIYLIVRGKRFLPYWLLPRMQQLLFCRNRRKFHLCYKRIGAVVRLLSRKLF